MIVERFLQWIGTAPVARRAEAAHALARAYLYSPLEEEERVGLEAAMTVLLDDPAASIRLALADALAASDQAPHHIILALAGDQPQIAEIVAERSPLLLDSELVDMVAGGAPSLQTAIARRPRVSRAVAAALAEVAPVEACLALLANGGAQIARFSLDRIVERHGDEPELREALLARDDLPVEVRQALIGRLSRALRELVTERNWLAPERADQALREAAERATVAMAADAPPEVVSALVERLIAAEELTPALLMRAVAAGQILLFQLALAALSGVPRPRVAALVASGRAANLRALLARAGLPPRTYPAFAAAIDVIRDFDDDDGPTTDYRRATALIDAIVNRYQTEPDRELDQILALLRRFAAEARRAAARSYAAQVMQAA
jgi:uncharacterized protein (DUF2336 family)